MLPKDYVRLRLCGEHATDVADASGTLLFDVARRRWSDAVVEALEVDPAWLPRALESPEVSGVTRGRRAGRGGRRRPGGRRARRRRRPRRGPASVVLGTSGVVFAASDAFAADPQARVHAFCHAVPGAWHSMGVMLSAAGSLRWLRDVVAPGADFGALVAEAARWEPGVEGLTFLPYLAGERTPHADPDARGAFTGLSLRHDRGALVRAVLEGVAFGLRDGLDLVAADRLAAARRSAASRAAARAATLWLRSSPRCSSCRCSARRSTRARRSARRCSAASRRACSPTSTRRWRRACARARSSSRSPAWIEPYRAARERFVALYPALRALR